MPRRKSFWLLLPLAALALSCTSDPKVKAQRYLENGNKFFAKGKFREASIMYRSALKQDLRFGEAYYRPSDDWISLPRFEAFKSRDTFYCVEFHELTQRLPDYAAPERDRPWWARAQARHVGIIRRTLRHYLRERR